jgi:uncharacterized RDD family membrane protein YckC
VTGTSASDAVLGVATGQPALVGRRLLAALYDLPTLLTLFLIGTALLLLVNGGDRLDANALSVLLHRATLVALWIAYYGICWTRFGQSLGMRVWRLRLMRLDGSRVRWRDALLRLASGIVAWLPLALGVLAAAWDSEHRAWHDRLSRTRVTT